MPNFSDKEKYVLHYENLELYLRLGLGIVENTSHIKTQSIAMAKTICWIQHRKKYRSRKKEYKDIKALYKLIIHVVYDKTMENVGNRIDAKLVSNKKGYLR